MLKFVEGNEDFPWNEIKTKTANKADDFCIYAVVVSFFNSSNNGT